MHQHLRWLNVLVIDLLIKDFVKPTLHQHLRWLHEHPGKQTKTPATPKTLNRRNLRGHRRFIDKNDQEVRGYLLYSRRGPVIIDYLWTHARVKRLKSILDRQFSVLIRQNLGCRFVRSKTLGTPRTRMYGKRWLIWRDHQGAVAWTLQRVLREISKGKGPDPFLRGHRAQP